MTDPDHQREIEDERESTMRSTSTIATLLLALICLVPASRTLAGFVENGGQYPDAVLFHGQGPGFSVALTETGLFLHLPGPTGRTPELGLRPGELVERSGHVLRIAPRDWVVAPMISTRSILPARRHYFSGLDGGVERSGIREWSEILLRDPASGEELVWRLDSRGLHYVSAGELECRGESDRLESGEGMLSLNTNCGTVEWQRSGAEPGHGSFVLPGSSDRRDIPGALLAGSFLGGTSSDGPRQIEESADGQVLLTGYTYSDDFPTTPGAYQESGMDHFVGFVAKFSADLQTLIWATYLGAYSVELFELAEDAAGNVIVVGSAWIDSGFPVTPGAYDKTHNGVYDLCAAKLSPAGDSLLWGTFIGGGADDIPVFRGLTLDEDENLLLVGHTSSALFPVTPGAYDADLGGETDAFLALLSHDGSSLLHATFFGGAGLDEGRHLALGGDGEIILGGITASEDLPVTPGAYQMSFGSAEASLYDGFLASLSSDLSTLISCSYLGGIDDDTIRAITVGGGAIQIYGRTASTDFPTTPGAFQTTSTGGDDHWLAEMSMNLGALNWCTLVGGSGDEPNTGGCDMIRDADGHLWVTGSSASADFPVTESAFDASYNGGSKDGVLYCVGADGASLPYASFLGGTSWDRSTDFFLDGNGEAVITGRTGSVDFPSTPDGYQPAPAGGTEVWVLRLDLEAETAVETAPARLRPFLSAYPNPFNPQTTIHFDLPAAARIRLEIFDIQGRSVALLAEGEFAAGAHELAWRGDREEGGSLSSGLYFTHLSGPDFEESQKLLMLK